MANSRPRLLPHRVMAWLAVVSLLTSVLALGFFGSGSAAADEPLEDVTPPEISDVAAVDITGTGARITWTTDEPATSQVEYGLLALFYGWSSPQDGTLTSSHSVTLSGLSAGTTYHYRVISADAGKNEARSGDYTFSTTATDDKKAPVISEATATGITSTSATIIWTTDEPATSQVEYGVRRYETNTPLDSNLVTSHSVVLTNLLANTNYQYRLKSTDAAGNAAQSARFTFRTLDANAPVISGVTAIDVTATSATIIWTTDEAATSQVDYGLTAGYGLTTGPNMALVKSHRMVLTGLVPKAVYYYGVKSVDATGNLAQSAGYAFTTADSDEPVISNVAATNITAMSVTFTWTTDDPAQSQVEYGTSPSYGEKTEVDYTLVTEHRVNLTGLRPQTTYYYKVKSRDDSGLWAWSEGHSFTTPDVTPPAISGVYSTDITANSATIAWTTNEAATSLVVYGTSTSYGSTTSQDMTLVTSHSVGLTGLSPQTTYHFRVKSSDAAGLPAQSGDFTFTTTDVGAPVISGVTAINVTMTGATITWTTDDLAESQVEYGTKATYGSITTLDTNRVTSHSVTLVELSPGTTYHYKVKSRDDSGIWAWTGDYTFTTVADPNSVVPGTSGTMPGAGGGTGTTITGEVSSFRLPMWAWAAIGVVVALVLGVMVVREV